MSQVHPPVPPRSAPARLIYRAVGLLAMILALAGLALPVLPTTPFLLVALWAFARGAPDWAGRLRRHPRFGPLIVNWEARRAIPRPAKAAAVLSMSGGWAVVAAGVQSVAASAALAAMMAAVLAYVLSRPSA